MLVQDIRREPVYQFVGTARGAKSCYEYGTLVYPGDRTTLKLVTTSRKKGIRNVRKIRTA